MDGDRTREPRGVVAAGHPQTAATGVEVLCAGGNAVDAGIAAMLASFAAEPLLTGLGAGGYMLVGTPEGDTTLLDFFVAAPGGEPAVGERAELVRVDVSFGDAVQAFHIGAASCAAYGTAAGACEAAARFGTLPMEELVRPAVARARDGATVTAMQAYVCSILEPIVRSTPECAELFAPGGRLLREGDRFRWPDLADSLERLGREGAAPFHTGDIAAAVADAVLERGGMLARSDLVAYHPEEREPVRASYRGREVVTNPPPSAGGILIALALSLLDREPGPPSPARLVAAMAEAQAARTAEFMEGLAEPGFAQRFLTAHLGATTHISVIDADGWACGVTCTNGEGSGIVVPGTGIHVNNILGEEDLNPFGFHRHPPGRRLPSMMAPTLVLREGEVELVVGSAGSNRIRSAILQTIVGVVDGALRAGPAVEAPRAHFEEGVVWIEPGIDTTALESTGHEVRRFRDRNLFFGGVQAAERDPATGELSGGGDPRRGGVAALA